MTADPPWQHWAMTFEWPPHMPPAMRAHLQPFVGHVMEKAAALATLLDDGSATEVIGALASHLSSVDPDRVLEPTANWALDSLADPAAIDAWGRVIAPALAAAAAPVARAAATILLIRVCHALATTRPDLDPDGVVLATAEYLEADVQRILLRVVLGVMARGSETLQ